MSNPIRGMRQKMQPGTVAGNLTNSPRQGHEHTVRELALALKPFIGSSTASSSSNGTSGGGTGDVSGPASAIDSDFAQFDGTTGKLIKDGGLSLDVDGTFTANSDAHIPSQKAVKTYVTAHAGTGTVTTTGTPASGNLTQFSGAASITNGDLSGDITTSGTLATSIKSSVALTGSPTTTTQAAGDNSTKIATTAFVAAATSGGGSGGGFALSPFFDPAAVALTRPSAASFTLNKSTNAGTSTLSNLASRGIVLAVNEGTTATATAEQAALSSSAFTLTAFLYLTGIQEVPTGAAIYIKDSTGKYVAYGSRNPGGGNANFEKYVYASLSGSITATSLGGAFAANSPLWFRVQLTGGNFIFSTSFDGENWQIVLTETATVIGGTISTVGIGAIHNGATASRFLFLDCFSWTNTSP